MRCEPTPIARPQPPKVCRQSLRTGIPTSVPVVGPRRSFNRPCPRRPPIRTWHIDLGFVQPTIPEQNKSHPLRQKYRRIPRLNTRIPATITPQLLCASPPFHLDPEFSFLGIAVQGCIRRPSHPVSASSFHSAILPTMAPNPIATSGKSSPSRSSSCPDAFSEIDSRVYFACSILFLAVFTLISFATYHVRKTSEAGKKLLGGPYFVALLLWIM